MATPRIERTLYEVPLRDIEVSEHNVRKTFDPEGIDELGKSIEKYSQLQPVVLMGEYGSPKYQLIVGQRRYNAIKGLGRPKILATFIKELSTVDAVIVSLAENIQRSNLSFEDMSTAITTIHESLKDVNKVAKALNISTTTVREYLKIESAAPSEVIAYARTHKIPKEDVKRAIRIAGDDKKEMLSTLKALKDLSKYQKDRAVELRFEEPKLKPSKVLEKAVIPRLTTTLVLSLSKDLNKALEAAKSELQEDGESIGLKALRSWLIDNGFID